MYRVLSSETQLVSSPIRTIFEFQRTRARSVALQHTIGRPKPRDSSRPFSNANENCSIDTVGCGTPRAASSKLNLASEDSSAGLLSLGIGQKGAPSTLASERETPIELPSRPPERARSLSLSLSENTEKSAEKSAARARRTRARGHSLRRRIIIGPDRASLSLSLSLSLAETHIAPSLETRSAIARGSVLPLPKARARSLSLSLSLSLADCAGARTRTERRCARERVHDRAQNGRRSGLGPATDRDARVCVRGASHLVPFARLMVF